MKYIATNDAMDKLNIYGLTEHEVIQEFKGKQKCMSDGNMGDLIINWKNEDLIILPIGRKTALIFEYGKEIKGSYEDLPEIEYKEEMWSMK